MTTLDYNPFAPDFYAHAFEVYRRMRDEAPVYYSERWGWYALTRFDDVRAAILDADTFRSFEGMDIDDTGKEQKAPGSLPDMDDPRHDEIRRIVQPFFLPRRIATLRDGIRSVVRDLLAPWRDRGEVDLAQELAWPMPFDVFFHLVGLPGNRDENPEQVARRELLEEWTNDLHGRVPGTPHLTPERRTPPPRSSGTPSTCSRSAAATRRTTWSANWSTPTSLGCRSWTGRSHPRRRSPA